MVFCFSFEARSRLPIWKRWKVEQKWQTRYRYFWAPGRTSDKDCQPDWWTSGRDWSSRSTSRLTRYAHIYMADMSKWHPIFNYFIDSLRSTLVRNGRNGPVNDVKLLFNRRQILTWYIYVNRIKFDSSTKTKSIEHRTAALSGISQVGF